MATDLTITMLTNQDRRFYRWLGPFLARRSIEQEMGGRIYDDDGVMWWIAHSMRRVVGFCAAADGRRVRLRSAYVTPPARRQGVYRALFTTRLAHLHERPLAATCTAASLPMLLTHGFTIVRPRGRFTEVTRD